MDKNIYDIVQPDSISSSRFNHIGFRRDTEKIKNKNRWIKCLNKNIWCTVTLMDPFHQ